MEKPYEWLTQIGMEPDSVDWGWLVEYNHTANTPYKGNKLNIISTPVIKEIHILRHTSLVRL